MPSFHSLFYASLIWGWILFFPLETSAQTIEELRQYAKTAQEANDQIMLYNQLADTLLWISTDLQEVEQILDKALGICEEKHCADDVERWTKAMKAELLALNYGDFGMLNGEILPMIETLKSKNEKTKDDDLFEAYLYELSGVSKLISGEIEAALPALLRAKYILENTQLHHKRLGKIYQYLAYLYNFRSKYDSAIIYMHQAEDHFASLTDTLLWVQASNGLSTFMMNNSQIDEATEVLLNANKLAELYPPAEAYKYSLIGSLADVYITQRQFDKGEKLLLKHTLELEKYEEVDLRQKVNELWDFYMQLSKIYTKTQRLPEGLEYVQKAVELGETYNLIPLQKKNAKLNEVDLHLAMHNYEQAALILNAVNLEINKGGDIDAFNVRIAHAMIKLYTESKTLPTLETILQFKPILERVVLKNEIENNEDLLTAKELLLLFSIAQNDQLSSLGYMRDILALKDSFMNAEQTRIANELMLEYETEKNEQQILIQALEIEKAQNYRNMLAIICVLLLLACGMLISYYRQKRILAKNLTAMVEERTASLFKANDELKQNNEELERFAYITSHDLKEPLRNILSFIGLIERQKLASEPLTEYLEHIERNAHQMYRLIEDVLAFTGLRQRKIGKESIDMNVIVRDVEHALYQQISEKKAKIVYNSLPTIQADHSMIILIVKNLIENAVKYNEAEAPLIEIIYLGDETSHHFSVKDNGIGIDPVYHERIFKMFKRLHNRENYEGSGLGLAICKHIIKFYQGDIRVESQEGEGSTFIFSIPL